MTLALDPRMYDSTSTVYELPDHVAGLGYEWSELSAKAAAWFALILIALT